MEKQIRIAVVGCGSRGMYSYAPYASKYDNVHVIAAAEPIDERREYFAKEFDLKPENCFRTAEELFAGEKVADVAFICTQDRQHYKHTMAALQNGYDVLLEKPVSNCAKECIAIAQEAKRTGRKVMVCHVLRYTPFYQKIKQTIESGRIGKVMAIQQNENVGWGHYAHSFVRGLWRNSYETSPMILAKCCHDMDILLWLMNSNCVQVSSFGKLSYFTSENAPTANERCDDSCPIYDKCPYQANAVYHNPKWEWAQMAVSLQHDEEHFKAALQHGPYGRCVFRCDNNVVDHQMVNLQFENGAVASLCMCAFTNEMTREIKVMGTLGEITGNMDANKLVIKIFGKEPEEIDVTKLATDLSGHGGGEVRLLDDLFEMVRDETGSVEALTSIDKSVQSHIMALASERSRVNGGRVVALKEIYDENR